MAASASKKSPKNNPRRELTPNSSLVRIGDMFSRNHSWSPSSMRRSSNTVSIRFRWRVRVRVRVGVRVEG